MFRHSVAIFAIAAAAAVRALPADAQPAPGPIILEGLVVTASPTPRALAYVAQHVTVLDGRDLELRGFASAADALRSVSGVDVVRGGSFGAVTSLFMRGGESDYTLVMVDGVQVNQAGGGFDFASLPTQNVERIEIVRGPGSALWGSDAVAGVINVITRVGAGGATRGSVRAESLFLSERDGVFDGTRLSADLAGGSERAGYSLALGRDAADGTYPFNSSHESLTLSGAARFLPDDRTRVSLTLRLQDRTHHYPTDGAGAPVDRNAFFFEDATLAQVALARAVGERLELEMLVGVAETDGGTEDGFDDASDTDAYRSLDHFRRASAQIRSHLRVGTSVLTLGAEMEEERQRSFDESLSAYGAFYGRVEEGRSNLAGFAHVTSQRGPLALSLGGRVEDNERFGNIATWQAGLSASPASSPGTRVRVAAGSSIKEPTFAENYATGFAVGNPDLEPEWSLSWEAGVEHDLVTGVTAGATFFRQRFEQMIQYTFTPPSPGDPNYFNVAEASARGVEVDVRVTRGELGASANWTWLDTEVLDAGLQGAPGDLFVKGEPLVRRPRHAMTFGASGPATATVRLHTELSLVGSRSDRDFSTFPGRPVTLPRHTLWSLGGEWVARPSASGSTAVSLSLRAENLLDRKYQEAFGFPAPGRQLRAGVRIAFGGGD